MQENMAKARVSVIVPTYNSSDTLQRCLESIQKQNYPFYEIIVVDNCSTDSTIETATKYGTKTISHRGNAASARNVGIAKSSGEYLLFLDSDQTVSKTLLCECVSICEKLDVGIIIVPETFIGRGFWSACSAAWKNLYFLLSKNCVDEDALGCEPRFFVKELIEFTGFFNEEFVWGEDYEFYLRLRRIHLKEAWCRSRIYHYEPETLAQILRKNYRYGKSMAHLQHVGGGFSWRARIIKQTYLTAREVPRNLPRSVLSWIGIFILLGLRTLVTVAGLLLAFRQTNT